MIGLELHGEEKAATNIYIYHIIFTEDFLVAYKKRMCTSKILPPEISFSYVDKRKVSPLSTKKEQSQKVKVYHLFPNSITLGAGVTKNWRDQRRR